ncbi:MAG TPA: hypothetical protein DCQ06_07540 [Myxococcales bacterium]|nr:hypothetical protein [Myxococcales bacterium]
MYFGFDGQVKAVVVGARGGLGQALCQRLIQAGADVLMTSRSSQWVAEDPAQRWLLDPCDEGSVRRLAEALTDAPPRIVINATGILHDGTMRPERTWRDLNPEQLQRYFALHASALGMLAKYVIPLMPRKGRTLFANLSARVGSIEDNRLGGWYGYRASKAAGNMILRCVALEARRSHPALVCVALHPGTVDTQLSKPFSARVPTHKLFSPPQSAAYLDEVVSKLDAAQTGTFWAWDGEPIPW